MRRIFTSIAVALLVAPAIASAQDDAKAVTDGGIKAPGWMGTADGGAAITTAKFATMGNGFHITTGPAATYWNSANKASGDYTVKATFSEPKFQNLNDHPHPYGIMIGGNDMGTPNATYFYCSVQGNGAFIARGMGPAPFALNGRRAEMNAVIHKAAGVGQPVTNDVAVSVKGDKVECSINGTVVGSYDKAMVVGTGKLKSTDGVYGLRSAHNTEVHVSNFSMTKN
jgi:hypothetical protein